MKKHGIYNSVVASVVASMGHGDSICIADAGLPIPNSTLRIDLAVTKGIPSILDVLDNLIEELEVEEVIVAGEMKQANIGLLNNIATRFPKNIIHFVTHEEFKKIIGQTRATIRTGEFSAFSNIILKSGVIF
jgi:D-ribose pyranase